MVWSCRRRCACHLPKVGGQRCQTQAAAEQQLIGPQLFPLYLAESDITASAYSVIETLEFWGFLDEVAGAVAEG